MSNKSPKIVLAPDSFKGCLTAKHVAEAMTAGILRGCSSAKVVWRESLNDYLKGL